MSLDCEAVERQNLQMGKNLTKQSVIFHTTYLKISVRGKKLIK